MRPELQRASGPVAVPERHLPRLAGGRGDHHLVLGDLLDAPAGGAEHEHLALPRFEHHLLVELADPPLLAACGAANAPAFGLRPPRGGAAGLPGRQEHAVQTAIGDGAGICHGDAGGALARPKRSGDPIPRQPRAQLGELVGGIAPGEHVEHAVERAAGQIRERRRPANELVDLVDLVHAVRGVGDDLLGEHVQGVARIERLLDLPGAHSPRGRGAAEQVAAVLGEHHPFWHAAHLVRGAPDALQTRRDRRRSLDLHDQVHRAHVDAELQRGRGDDRRQSPPLEPILHLLALVARDRPVVGERHLRAGKLVERAREPLREAPAVDEDHRRAMRPDELEQPRMDGRPDASPLRPGGSRPGGDLLQLAEPGQVVDRHLHPDLQLLLRSRVDDRHRPRPPFLPGGLSAAEQARHLVERALGGGEADALELAPRLLLKALEGEE